MYRPLPITVGLAGTVADLRLAVPVAARPPRLCWTTAAVRCRLQAGSRTPAAAAGVAHIPAAPRTECRSVDQAGSLALVVDTPFLFTEKVTIAH